MKTILRAAKVELAFLFYTPVAWLVLLISTVQGALVFGHFLELYAGDQEAGWPTSRLTSSIFIQNGEGNSLILLMRQNLLLYVPVLTMSLISRERNSGSIRLLQSSPITSLRIVMGKFTAMLGLGLIMMAVLAVFIEVGMRSIFSMDISLIISAIVGLFLLLMTYAAIGLYLSSLTAYPAIAALSTFAVITALTYMSRVGQEISWIRNLTYYLRLPERMDQFCNGLVSSSNIFYFVSVILFFLGMTLLRLEGDRNPGISLRKATKYLLLGTFCVLLGFFSSRPKWVSYMDLTADKSETLTIRTEDILKKIKDHLRVHTYVNILDDTRSIALPQSQNRDFDFWERYRRFRPDLQIDYVYYYDSSHSGDAERNFPGLSLRDLALKYASIFHLDTTYLRTRGEVMKYIDLRGERGQLVRQLAAGKSNARLRVFNDMAMQPGEAEIAAALRELIYAPPTIGFLTGNYERRVDRDDGEDYGTMATAPDERDALINQGFNVIFLSPDSEMNPDKLAALVVADPRSPLSPHLIQSIRQYIALGGNLMITGEPGRQDILNPILQAIGVRLSGDTLLSPNDNIQSALIYAHFNLDTGAHKFLFSRLQGRQDAVILNGVTGLQYNVANGFDVTPVLVANERKVSIPLLLAMTRKIQGRSQHILIAGDADLFSGAELNRTDQHIIANGELPLNLFGWLTNAELPVDVSRADPTDSQMLIRYQQAARIRLLLSCILPGLILSAALILLIYRRRR